MKDLQHIFFDLDHTLWDFERNSRETLLEIYQNFQLKSHHISFEAFIDQYEKINDLLWAMYREGKISKDKLRAARFHETLERFGINNIKMAAHMGFYYIDHSPKKTHLIEGAEDILSYLKSRYSLHIITNGFEEVQWIKIENCGLKGYFDVIVTSEMAKVKKPDPKIFHFAMDLAKAQSHESIMIGDNESTDIIGAQKAGIASILFAKKRPEQTVANYFVDDLLKIKKLL